ncbi:hypothetical protein V144x_32990 [Gimesia aquarii]|uniref:Uncharacterized protein n=1 Tax=Gimesia aquarii TaxID=2527964 RepID=A0A517VXT6_9PLAN|nr:hypothetical protein V144x_32990 [Gimesia aquarii]
MSRFLMLTAVLFVSIVIFNSVVLSSSAPGEPLTATEMENVFATGGWSDCTVGPACSSPESSQSCGIPDDGAGTCTDSGILTSGRGGQPGLVCGSCSGADQESCALSGCYFWCTACTGSTPMLFCCNKKTCRFRAVFGQGGVCECFQNLLVPTPHNSRETCT